MKNSIVAAMLCALCVSIPMESQADDIEPGGYFGLGYLFLNYDEKDVPDADLGGIMVRGGYQFNDYIATEARVGYGLRDDSVEYLGMEVDLDLKETYGAYLKLGIPTEFRVYPYLIGGATYANLEVNVPGYGSERFDETDVSYGGGIDFYLDPSLSLTAEYMMLIDKNDAQWSGVTLTLNLKFW